MHGREAISDKNEAIIHKTIKKVTEDIDELKMNTAIAALMTMVNEFYANGCTKGDMEQLLLMLSPFAPHMVEELWERLGFAAKYGKMAMPEPWPEYDESKTVAPRRDGRAGARQAQGHRHRPRGQRQQAASWPACRSRRSPAMEGMQIVKVILVKEQAREPDREAAD